MTETAGDKPFPGFPGFPPAEMLDKMWEMMRLTPFGAAFPGTQPGTAQGFASPLTAMSDMMSPLMSVEELDKRITDLRAVEQWLKLNLNMLQSAIQAMEVQRATLATLSAFGAFAQSSMTEPPKAEPSPSASAFAGWGQAPGGEGAGPAVGAAAGEADAARQADREAGKEGGEQADAASPPPAFDPSIWWNLLQSQFNQLAAFAMQPEGTDAAGAGSSGEGPKSKRRAANGSDAKARGGPGVAGTAASAAKTGHSAKAANSRSAADPAKGSAPKATAAAPKAGSRPSARKTAGKPPGE